MLNRVLVVSLLVLFAVLACRPGDTPGPAGEESAVPLAHSSCGNGVCDSVEQKDPSLCPQDCPPPETTTEPLPDPTAAPELEPTDPSANCGDGLCDEVEQKDPALCPQDCATPTRPAETPTVRAAITVEVTEEATGVPTQSPAPTDTPLPEPTDAPPSATRQAMTAPSGELVFVGDAATITQEGADAAEPAQSNVVLILDGSGSMGEELPGTGQTKLAVAKDVMTELILQIPAELDSTLWIYAHRFPPQPKAESCKDIEQVFPLGSIDTDAYVAKIQAIQANGWTPIADSIVAAAEGLPEGDFNSMILVSDGEETCGGDPCAVAEALKAADVELTVHVVGYAVDDATRAQLECIARVSGGSYHDAMDAEGLLRALEEALAAAVVETVLRVEIIEPAGSEVSDDLLLYESGTDQKVSYYRTWNDNIVPPGRYDLQIFALPGILYPGLELPEGSTTVVHIVLGSLSVLSPEGEQVMASYHEAGTDTDLGFWGHEGPVVLVPGSYYVAVDGGASAPVEVAPGAARELVLGAVLVRTPEGETVAADIYDAATGERLGSYGHDGPALLVPGTYQASYNGSTSSPIAIESGQTVELALGGILVLTPEGEPVAADFWDAATDERLGSYGYGGPALFVPGTYIVDVYRSYSEPIALEPGQVVEVRLGGVHVDGSFTIWDAEGNRLGAYGDTMLLVPGTYKLELADGTVVEEVVVEAGEVTEIQ